MAKERIGFIGLGIMGKPMARNLLKAGYPLVVHSRSRPPVDEMLAAGAADGKSPRGVAQQSDIIITMLPDSPDVQQVVLGRDGVLEGIRAGAVLVDMSTISPLVTQEIAQTVTAKGAQMLDAPVSGGEKGAIEATLSIMVGGPDSAFTRVRPVLETLGKNIVHIGGPRAGQGAKGCNQNVVALTIPAVSGALAPAAQAGVGPAPGRQGLVGGVGPSPTLT